MALSAIGPAGGPEHPRLGGGPALPARVRVSASV